MNFLIDTDVISATSPLRYASDVQHWLEARSDRLFLSAVTISELERGIAKLYRTDKHRKAEALSDWLDALLRLYARRILPFDTAVAQLAGRLADQAVGAGHDPGFADVAIAATAQHHQMTVLTRNLRHFEPLGVIAADPFAALPN